MDFSLCMVIEIVLCMKLTSDEQIYSLKSVAEVRDTFSQQDVFGITGNSLKNEYYVTEHNGYTEMYKIFKKKNVFLAISWKYKIKLFSFLVLEKLRGKDA